MISICEISKSFEEVKALAKVSLTIEKGTIWGILGINGAGKSTLLKIMAGILRADEGVLSFSNQALFDNQQAKKEVFYLPDDPYFFPNATVSVMADYYKGLYSEFDMQRFRALYEALGLDDIRKLRTFSKGMKRQVFILLAICSNTSYLLCDEIFDGLDPIIRTTIQELLVREVDRRGLTLVIASHNLKELDQFCEYIGIIHEGGMLFSKELRQLKSHIHKYQCVYNDQSYQELTVKCDVLSVDVSGFVITCLIKGNKEQIEEAIKATNVKQYEVLPLTIEEIFIYESEVSGYDLKTILS